MYYYIYQITNLVNNKIYVGVHKTKNLDDGYMGSGKIIRSAMEKYGPENFRKDILEFFENAELMYAREKEIVTEEFLLREDTYNLRRGGTGGFDYINSNNLGDRTGYRFSDHQKKQISESRKLAVTEEHRNQISERNRLTKPALGKKHKNPPKKSQEHKLKISQANLGVKQEIVECPVCNAKGGKRAMKRWHFDNCGSSSVGRAQPCQG